MRLILLRSSCFSILRHSKRISECCFCHFVWASKTTPSSCRAKRCVLKSIRLNRLLVLSLIRPWLFFLLSLKRDPEFPSLWKTTFRFYWRQRRHDLCRVGTYLCFASLPIVAPSCHHPKGNTVNSDFSARSLTVGKQQMCGAAANVVTRWVEVVKSVPNEVYPALVLVKRWALIWENATFHIAVPCGGIV